MAIANIKVTLLCSIEEVWNKITNLHDFSWRSDLQNIKIIDDNNFVEVSRDGIETHFEVTDFLEHKCWAFKIENENIVGTWTGKFYSHGDRTTLDFTENIVSKKLIFKPFIGSYIRKQQRLYFNDLKEELNCEEASFVQNI